MNEVAFDGPEDQTDDIDEEDTKDDSNHDATFQNDKYVGKKLFMELKLEGRHSYDNFHDTGAAITLVGIDYLSKILPNWEKLESTEPIKVSSHTNHSLKILSAKWIKIGIPGTDFEVAHKVAIEAGNSGIVLGMDFISKYKVAL